MGSVTRTIVIYAARRFLNWIFMCSYKAFVNITRLYFRLFVCLSETGCSNVGTLDGGAVEDGDAVTQNKENNSSILA